MKKLFVVLAGILCILSACQKGPNPKDSLVAAGKALQNCDADNVDKYIDLTSIMSSAIDFAAKQEINAIPKEQIMGLTVMKAVILPVAKEYILEAIREYGKNENKEYSQLVKVKKYEILSNKDGIASAKVIFDFSAAKEYAQEKGLLPEEVKPYLEDTERTLILKMKQNGEYWQITEISNLDEIFAKYAPLYEENLKKQKIKQGLYEALMTANMICKAQVRYHLQTGQLISDFSTFDIDFRGDDGAVAQGGVYVKKEVTYTLDGSKVVARGVQPAEYTIEKDCISNETVCNDNGKGICEQIGLQAI